MSKLKIFKSEEFGNIRTITINEEPWLAGKDVAIALGYSNPQKAVRDHVSEEDRGVNEMDTPSGKQNLAIINESGLYSLILSSKLPTAKKFKHWVTSEVLPSIRKHGTYMTENTLEQALTNPDFLIQLATKLKEEQEARKRLEKKVEADKPHTILGRAITTANTSILVGDLAKLAKQNGVNTGAKRMFEWMRENGYLIKRKGTDWNLPTQRSMEMGLFEIKESVHVDGNGCNKITRTPKVTGKGQEYFINKFLTGAM